MVGLWSSTRTHAYSVITSSTPGDCTRSMLRRHFAYGEKSVIDHIHVTSLMDNATMRPIHDMIMHTESVRMAQLRYILTRIGAPAKSLKDVKTDAYIIGVGIRKLAAVKGVGTIRYDELHMLRRKYELSDDPTQGFLNEHIGMTPLTSSDCVCFGFPMSDTRWEESTPSLT